jgi:hypothetical protein
MTLKPNHYECTEHHADLTGQVEEAVSGEGWDVPLAYGSPYRRLISRKRVTGDRPFQVIVTCRGNGGTGPHSLTCTGTWTQ